MIFFNAGVAMSASCALDWQKVLALLMPTTREGDAVKNAVKFQHIATTGPVAHPDSCTISGQFKRKIRYKIFVYEKSVN